MTDVCKVLSILNKLIKQELKQNKNLESQINIINDIMKSTNFLYKNQFTKKIDSFKFIYYA